MKPKRSLRTGFTRLSLTVILSLLAVRAQGQITEVHTNSGGTSLRTIVLVREFPGDPGKGDADEALPASDFTNYNESVESSADKADLSARGRASAQASLSHTATNLSFTASGDTSISATRTGGESDNVSGAGGVSALDLSFTLTERCSFSFSTTAFVSTNGRTESSETEVQFQGGGGNDDEIDITVTAGDEPGIPLVASTSRSGFLPPGTYFLTGFTSTSLGDTQAAADSSFTISLTLSVAPENNPDVQDIVWRTPTSGSFGDDGNWFPEKVPDGNDSAIFNKSGNYTVDVGLRNGNRVEISRGRVTFANAIYQVDALSQELASLRVNGNGELTLDEGAMAARHVILGDIGVLGTPGRGTLFVRGGVGLTASGLMRIGGVGQGGLLVDEGTTCTSDTTSIGSPQSGSIATVGGDNTKWTTGNLMMTGSLPKLNVARGASVTSSEVVADATTALFGGTINVDGTTDDGTTSSLWTVQQRLTLNNGTLNIQQHGHVLANSILLADKKSHFAEIFVKGNKAIGATAPRAQLDVATSLVVGGLGRGRVTISEGAMVTAQANVAISGVPGLDSSDPGNGEVFVVPATEVAAPRSTLQIEGKLQMGFGQGGKGLLRMTDGTLVSCNSAEIGLGANSFSGIELIRASGQAASQPEMNVTNDMVLGFGLGSAAVIALTDGELNVGGNLTVNSNCAIQGTGEVTVGGTLDLNGTGFISPGLSPGVLTINGNVTVGAEAFIDAEAAGPDVGAESDQLIINGNLTLNGALNLRFINGYAPRQGESVSVLKVSGATTGNVTGINVSGLAPGAQFNVAMTNGTLTATALNDTVSLPVVSIPLAPKKIGEKAKRGGAAIFKRKGDVTAPLTVNYSILGSADNGIDHTLLTGEVTFPAKKKIVKVTVKPLDDLEFEGNETVSIKILPGDDYTVALKSNANVALVDNEKRRKK